MVPTHDTHTIFYLFNPLQAFPMKSYLFFQHGDVFFDCWEPNGDTHTKFHQDTLCLLPSSALQAQPLPAILKKKNKKKTSKNVRIGSTRYQHYFTRKESQACWRYMMESSHHFRHSSTKCEQEMVKVEAQAVEWKDHILHLAGRDVLPIYLQKLFKCCLSGGSFVSTATFEELNVFVDACTDLKLDMKRAATTIQRASRVPRKAVFAKLTLWDRLYKKKIKSKENTKSKVKTTSVEVKPTSIKPSNLTHRVYKPCITSKKNRAVRQTTLSSMRKTKKAANLARRRGLATTSTQVVKVAQPQLILAVPSAPIKKRKDLSIITELIQPIKLEQVLQKYMSFVFISILPTLKMSPLIEQDEPVEFKSILKSSKCEIRPIMEVDESEKASTTDEPCQQEQEHEASTTTDDGDYDIDFGQADEVEDIELNREVEEPVQVTNVPSTPPRSHTVVSARQSSHP